MNYAEQTSAAVIIANSHFMYVLNGAAGRKSRRIDEHSYKHGVPEHFILPNFYHKLSHFTTLILRPVVQINRCVSTRGAVLLVKLFVAQLPFMDSKGPLPGKISLLLF
jgi:hypothetical protein